MPRTFPLLLSLLFAGLPATISATGTAGEQPLQRLLRWERGLEREGELSLERLAQLEEILVELREVRGGEEGRAAHEALLDLSVLGLETMPSASHRQGLGNHSRLRKLAFEELQARAAQPGGAELLDWLVVEVLIAREREPLMRRRAALALLDVERTTRARIALLRLGRDEQDPLRPDLLWLLPTWPGEAVDLFLVELLGKPWPAGARPHPFTLILHRLRDVGEPLGERARLALEERIALMLIATDWRDASRGIELARGLEPRVAVPFLLDALSAWERREQRGMGSRRIAGDIQHELRRISGRSIGNDPRAWVAWWIAVRQGRIPLYSETHADGQPMSRAAFFGLRPLSDRVVFVIDASGSMQAGFGTRGHSRYVESIEQMTRFLQAAGERTQFNVVLFNSVALLARPEMIPATAENLEAVRTALLAQQAGGNTLLKPAIELALGIEDADTIVVLCDGATASGPAWVRPALDRIRAERRVVFHCVLLASSGDGTLEALAGETGGDFVHVGG